MNDKLEQLEKNLGKNKEVVIKSLIFKVDSEGISIFGKKIWTWRSKKNAL